MCSVGGRCLFSTICAAAVRVVQVSAAAALETLYASCKLIAATALGVALAGLLFPLVPAVAMGSS